MSRKVQVFSLEQLNYTADIFFALQVHVGRGFFVFGGNQHTHERHPEFVQYFDFCTLRWKSILPTGMSRPSKNNLLMSGCFDQVDTIYLFGGSNFADKSKNLLSNAHCTLYSFNIRTNSYKQIETGGISPEARAGATMCYHNNALYLFGGCIGNRVSRPQNIHGGIWKFDLSKRMWEMVHTKNPGPCVTYHTANVIGSRMYVFGGWGQDLETGKTGCSDRMYSLDLEIKKWREEKPQWSDILKPQKRMLHNSCKIGRYILYGFGVNNFKPVYLKKSFYLYNTLTKKWFRIGKLTRDVGKQLVGKKEISFYFYGNLLAFNPRRNDFLCYGGQKKQAFVISLNDLELKKAFKMDAGMRKEHEKIVRLAIEERRIEERKKRRKKKKLEKKKKKGKKKRGVNYDV